MNLWEASAQPVSIWRTPRVRSLVGLGMLAGVIGLLAISARVYTDLLWFGEVGQVRVLLTTLKWKIEARALFPFATTCFLLLNFVIAERALAARGPVVPQWRRVASVWTYRMLIYPVFAIGCGVAVHELRVGPTWQQLLLWTHRSDFGQTDPLFHRDVGFYVFSLPLYQALVYWLLATLAAAAVAALAVYTAAGAVRVVRPRGSLRAARWHLLGLAALLLLVAAARLRLDQYAFALPHRGSVVPGASYTDVHVRLPAVRVLTWLTLAGAVGAAYAAVKRVPSSFVAALAALAALILIAATALPSLIESFDVAPQELARERPFIEDSIASTRRAYDLDAARVVPLAGDGELSAQDIADNRDTLDNISLWDSNVLRAAMNEIESIGRYYNFPSTTVDRYKIDGALQLVTLAARSLDLSSIGGWATQRFAYTHGYGVVAARAGAADPQRYPQFAEHNFDSKSNPLGVREPRIYFGELPGSDPPYAVVDSKRGEVEQPKPGSESPNYHYDGPGGIPLSSALRRVAFAARFGDLKLLLTETATDQSRIVLHRNVRERLIAVAPFLHWDRRPETAVIDGRVKFLFHGYTTSANYPYSEPVRFSGTHVNYVRSAAQASIDAYTGEVSIYAAESEDPILRAWKAAYPSLFLPASEMPADLRAHLRYPKALFNAQSQAYQAYHATNATGFWNNSDVWQRPLKVAGPVENAGEIRFPNPTGRVDPDERRDRGLAPSRWQLRPEYLLARLPGDKGLQFMLAQPFTPLGRNNLVSYLSGSLDGLGRPRLTVLSLPRDQSMVGPAQATRRILASPGVNRRIELLNKESRDLGHAAINRTVLGVPRVVPVGDTLLHVQPIYVTAGGSSVPRLQLVTVHANGRVGYGRDLDAALKRVLPEAEARKLAAPP